MADNEPTISMAGINAPPLYRLVEDGGKTVIMTADTNTPMWVINGDIAGGAKPMTTAERTAITPAEGELIYDTDLGSVYVGDGVTPGGVAVGGGGGGGGDYTFSNEFTVTAAGGVSINAISASKITGKVGSAGVADALINGATVSYAQSAGTAATATTATTANGVTQAVKDDIISSAGGGSLDGEIADVDEVMTGITGGTTAVVDVSGLRGALTAGQAVDVTSQPDGETGDWKGTFYWTDSDGYLGFDNSFPKFASGLTYLLIADLTYDSAFGDEHILISPSGTWLDGTKTAIRIDDGETKRVAMIFASKTGKLTVDSFDMGDSIEVTHLREYEVTACSNEAIAYIAALSNPDSFQDYYLVKRDMVSPWTYIIDMGESPATTVAAGLAYQIKALTGSHIITTDTCPAGYIGRDAWARIFIGDTGNVVVQSPLVLGTPLVANAINNCIIQYRDGEAVLSVTDTLGGYIISLASGTTDGSLYYGLITNDDDHAFISIPSVFDGIPVDLGGASVSALKHVVGTGISNTIVSGTVNAGAGKLALSNLSLSDVGITGGTLTIPTGVVASGTVAVSSGASAIFDGGAIVSGGTMTLSSGGEIRVTSLGGSGGIVDLNHVRNLIAGATASIAGVTVTNGAGIPSGAESGYGGGIYKIGGVLNLTSVNITGNTGRYGGGALFGNKAIVSMTDCIVRDNVATVGGGGGAIRLTNATVHIYGELKINQWMRTLNATVSGNILFHSGATLNITNPKEAGSLLYVDKGGIVFENDVQILTGATVDVPTGTVSVTGGTYQGINGQTGGLYNPLFLRSGTAITTGPCTLPSTSIVNMTGNTNTTVLSAAAIIVSSGAKAITTGGSTVSITAGTYTVLHNDGTAE